MRSLAALLALSMVCLQTVAQEKLVETIEVRVVNVDVVVTDRSGKPVTGLTKDDFELFENGKPQVITNFYEIAPQPQAPAVPGTPAQAAPPVPAEVRSRRIVVFIDNYSLHPFRRNDILKSLQKFIDAQMRPGDEAELVLWTGSLSVVTPFTGERKTLINGIDALSKRSRSAMSQQMEMDRIKRRIQEYVAFAVDGKMSWGEALSRAQGDANAYSDEVWTSTRNLVEAMRLTVSTLAGLEGKKVLVLAGAHLPQNPGLDMQKYVYSTFSQYIRTLSPTDGISEAASRSQKVTIEHLAEQASAEGVTVYVIDAADDRDFVSAEQSEPVSADEQFSTFADTAMAYQQLTSLTGGKTVATATNFDGAFETVGNDLGAYYSLGYKPVDASRGMRRLSVRTKERSWVVRSRQTYVPKTVEESISDRVVANLYHSVGNSEWELKLRIGRPQQNGNRFGVPIEVTIPSTVTLLPQGDDLVGGFTVYVAVGNDAGGMSKVIRSPQPIRIPQAAEQKLRSKPLVFTATIVVRPGENIVSVAAADQIGGTTGFAKTRFVAN